MRCATSRTPRTPRWSVPLRPWNSSLRGARSSPTSATICRTRVPRLSCRRTFVWLMTAWKSRSEIHSNMRVYRSLGELPPDFGPSAVTIGNFDGVHRGHCEILRRVKALADARGWKASVLTFDPHPTKVVAPERAPKLMTTPERRAELMAAAGAEQVLILPFDRSIAQWSPEEFARQLLAGRLGARAVLVGDNFRFGCRQAGDTRMLEALGRQLNFDVEIAPAVSCRGQVISSSGIRSLICAGKLS